MNDHACDYCANKALGCDRYESQPASTCESYKENRYNDEKPTAEVVVEDTKEIIRKFETGATRDTIEGKLDYVKALSPIVLRRYVQYLDKHRLQPDGSMRGFDNWKQGIPQETYHSSGGRHFFDTWLLSEGYEAEDNHGPVTDIEDTLCAEIFNKMGRLHEILKARLTKD